MDQGRRETMHRGYRTITTTGFALLVVIGSLLLFACLWEQSQQGWADFPLNATWADAGALVLGALVPGGARMLADFAVARTARRGIGTKLSVALQVVSWATLGIWLSCQVPLLLGFAVAVVRHRTLLLLPFFAVAAGAAMLFAPKFAQWEEWFGLLEHPRKKTRMHTV